MTRQEAIERLNYLNNKCDPYECPDTECHKCDEAVDMAIEALQQEPKRGYWLEAKEEDPCWYRCSECGRLYDLDENYCPNCGARMEGNEE